MASPPPTNIHPTEEEEEEVEEEESSIGQLNELQFNPAAGDEVAVDAADPAGVEWLITRGFVRVPGDRLRGQVVLRYPGRTGGDDVLVKDEESVEMKHHDVEVLKADEGLKDEESVEMKHHDVVDSKADEGSFVEMSHHDDVVLKADEGSFVEMSYHDEYECLEVFEKICPEICEKYEEEESATTVAASYSLPLMDIPAAASGWTSYGKWHIQSREQGHHIGVIEENGKQQKFDVKADFLLAHSKQANSTLLRLQLTSIRVEVDYVEKNSTTCGYFVYQIEIAAEPALQIHLVSAKPDSDLFSFNKSQTSSASVTGSLSSSLQISATVGSTRQSGHVEVSHRLLPARIYDRSVIWKWQMQLWEDGQKFDSDNPENFEIRGKIPGLPLDPRCISLVKAIEAAESTWEVEKEMVEDEKVEEFEFDVNIRLFAAYICKKSNFPFFRQLPTIKKVVFSLNSTIKIPRSEIIHCHEMGKLPKLPHETREEKA